MINYSGLNAASRVRVVGRNVTIFGVISLKNRLADWTKHLISTFVLFRISLEANRARKWQKHHIPSVFNLWHCRKVMTVLRATSHPSS
jgi:hypothetical protein